VLVVEDEVLVREAIVKTLQDAGWDVWEASSAEGAIALLQNAARAVSVLFTDIQLNGHLSGWDLADAFRQAHPEASIVYTSGNTVDRRRQVRDSLFFSKPYDPAEIVKACGRVMG
jgi:CheY-like chemotaxis protein